MKANELLLWIVTIANILVTIIRVIICLFVKIDLWCDNFFIVFRFILHPYFSRFKMFVYRYYI